MQESLNNFCTLIKVMKMNSRHEQLIVRSKIKKPENHVQIKATLDVAIDVMINLIYRKKISARKIIHEM